MSPDIRAIRNSRVIVTTPEKWDGISRSWQTRKYVQDVSLIVIDEIHLLGEDRGPVLEVIVSRLVACPWLSVSTFCDKVERSRQGCSKIMNERMKLNTLYLCIKIQWQYTTGTKVSQRKSMYNRRPYCQVAISSRQPSGGNISIRYGGATKEYVYVIKINTISFRNIFLFSMLIVLIN